MGRKILPAFLIVWVVYLGSLAHSAEAGGAEAQKEAENAGEKGAAQICRDLRQQRDALAVRAMEEEMALVRTYRSRICPRLAEVAEGANARDQRFAPLDYAAWSNCRQRAEHQLEGRHSVRYRNSQAFTFYTPAGASLARQGDLLLASLKARGCL